MASKAEEWIVGDDHIHEITQFFDAEGTRAEVWTTSPTRPCLIPAGSGLGKARR
jgi:hypothetical protein